MEESMAMMERGREQSSIGGWNATRDAGVGDGEKERRRGGVDGAPQGEDERRIHLSLSTRPHSTRAVNTHKHPSTAIHILFLSYICSCIPTYSPSHFKEKILARKKEK